MTAPDFEINAGIRAKRLVAHVPPDAQTQAEGEDVTLDRHEQRSGVPAKMEAGERYSDVVIDKRIVGETQHGHTIGDAPGQGGQDRGQAAPEASEAAARAPKRKNSSPRSRKRSATVASSSAGDGLAEAVRNISEGAAILREVRHSRRRG